MHDLANLSTMETNITNFSSEWIEISAARQARRGLAAPAWQALGYLLAAFLAARVSRLGRSMIGLRVLFDAVRWRFVGDCQ